MGLADLTRRVIGCHLNPVSAFEKGGSEGPHLIGREGTGTLATNHMRAFRPSFSKAETGFKSRVEGDDGC